MREDHVQFIIDHFELRGQKEYASIARQLAEENAKLRNVLYEIRDSGNIHDVTRLAIDALAG